jgi:hypothetical protein
MYHIGVNRRERLMESCILSLVEMKFKMKHVHDSTQAMGYGYQ